LVPVKRKIDAYELEWNPVHGPGYRLKLHNLPDWTKWLRITASDFTAIALILKEERSYYDEITNTVFSITKQLNQGMASVPAGGGEEGIAQITSNVREVDDIPPDEQTPNIGDDTSADSDSFERDASSMLPSESPPLHEKGMRWRVAKSLEVLRTQINNLAPDRSKVSDGTIGDPDHRKRNSDHNPWVVDGGIGVVTALDITHDLSKGCDANEIAQSIRESRDARVKYMIWNRQIANSSPVSGQPAWVWRPYAGANPHNQHIHISVRPDKMHYDAAAPWNVLVRVPVV
jgi:hypothetical protein